MQSPTITFQIVTIISTPHINNLIIEGFVSKQESKIHKNLIMLQPNYSHKKSTLIQSLLNSQH